MCSAVQVPEDRCIFPNTLTDNTLNPAHWVKHCYWYRQCYASCHHRLSISDHTFWARFLTKSGSAYKYTHVLLYTQNNTHKIVKTMANPPFCLSKRVPSVPLPRNPHRHPDPPRSIERPLERASAVVSNLWCSLEHSSKHSLTSQQIPAQSAASGLKGEEMGQEGVAGVRVA